METEVLVIGAGAGGAALSWRLATQGVRVLCLEAGGWAPPETGPADQPDWERRRMRDWHPNPNRRAAFADYPVDDSACPIRPLMFAGVGGSTVMWSAHLPRFHPSDYRMRTLDAVGDDWPLTYDELAPYYALNERMSGCAGAPGNPAYPPGQGERLPPASLLPFERDRVVAGFERLGWHWWPADIAVTTRDLVGRSACNHCGPCEIGCHRRAKASADITYWPAALAAGARLVAGARVERILTDAAGERATGAVWLDARGARHRVAADVVVVAANGLGTPRLLLLSRSARFPEGLANDSGLVGRRLMLHPLARLGGRFAEQVGGHRGIAAGGIVSRQFYETDLRRGFVRGFKMQVLRGTGPTGMALAGGGLGRLPWGSAHHAAFARSFGHTLAISICADDLPEEANRVELAPDRADAQGLPGVRMIYRVGENSRAILDHGLARAAELMAAIGAEQTQATPLVADAGFHLMGTARMGDDPAASVVDRWGRAHAVPNLYLADGSTFVTAAAVNPAHTIQALALRSADHILARRGAGMQ
ncbi:GMC family oxidoreductase [Falsiroseomonas sp.]|uniref:GMC family oxidoreductase n=1 Tax=Falsiroseomonas sp. TaxID=2870721 RepID=UPI003569F084